MFGIFLLANNDRLSRFYDDDDDGDGDEDSDANIDGLIDDDDDKLPSSVKLRQIARNDQS